MSFETWPLRERWAPAPKRFAASPRSPGARAACGRQRLRWLGVTLRRSYPKPREAGNQPSRERLDAAPGRTASPHVLWQTFAFRLPGARVPVLDVLRQLGHRSAGSTRTSSPPSGRRLSMRSTAARTRPSATAGQPPRWKPRWSTRPRSCIVAQLQRRTKP